MVKFVGTYLRTIDDRGRVAVPYRREEWLICTNESMGELPDERYLEMFTDETYEYKLRDYIEPYMLIRAHEDNQGRILIPPELKKYAGLSRNVVFLGNDLTIRLWDSERWQDYLSRKKSTIPHP